MECLGLTSLLPLKAPNKDGQAGGCANNVGGGGRLGEGDGGDIGQQVSCARCTMHIIPPSSPFGGA